MFSDTRMDIKRQVAEGYYVRTLLQASGDHTRELMDQQAAGGAAIASNGGTHLPSPQIHAHCDTEGAAFLTRHTKALALVKVCGGVSLVDVQGECLVLSRAAHDQLVQ